MAEINVGSTEKLGKLLAMSFERPPKRSKPDAVTKSEIGVMREKKDDNFALALLSRDVHWRHRSSV